MKDRLWYPQLDVYDAVRRMSLLLYAWHKESPGLERFFISDFYLANPPLLHRTNMPQEVRSEFAKLSVPRPEKTFLSFPAPPLLFHKMEPIQKQAIQALTGKGIVDPSTFQRGKICLSAFGKKFVDDKLSDQSTPLENKVVRFLTTKFVELAEGGIAEFRRRTGLRRVV